MTRVRALTRLNLEILKKQPSYLVLTLRPSQLIIPHDWLAVRPGKLKGVEFTEHPSLTIR